MKNNKVLDYKNLIEKLKVNLEISNLKLKDAEDESGRNFKLKADKILLLGQSKSYV